MERFTIDFETYTEALATSEGEQRVHLINDFIITPDGRVIAKLDNVTRRSYNDKH